MLVKGRDLALLTVILLWWRMTSAVELNLPGPVSEHLEQTHVPLMLFFCCEDTNYLCVWVQSLGNKWAGKIWGGGLCQMNWDSFNGKAGIEPGTFWIEGMWTHKAISYWIRPLVHQGKYYLLTPAVALQGFRLRSFISHHPLPALPLSYSVLFKIFWLNENFFWSSSISIRVSWFLSHLSFCHWDMDHMSKTFYFKRQGQYQYIPSWSLQMTQVHRKLYRKKMELICISTTSRENIENADASKLEAIRFHKWLVRAYCPKLNLNYIQVLHLLY